MLKLLICILIAILAVLQFRRRENFSSEARLYGRMSCPYTAKMVNALKESNLYDRFVYVDTSTKAGSKQLQKAGGSGVPYFTHNGKTATGYMKPEELMEKLNLH